MAFMGTMDEGYFVSRKDILGWVNGTLNTDLATVDELGKGDIYCRLIHHFHPGSVQLSKVLMEPKMEYESILNLKYLQNALERLGSTKKIDVNLSIPRSSRSRSARRKRTWSSFNG